MWSYLDMLGGLCLLNMLFSDRVLCFLHHGLRGRHSRLCVLCCNLGGNMLLLFLPQKHGRVNVTAASVINSVATVVVNRLSVRAPLFVAIAKYGSSLSKHSTCLSEFGSDRKSGSASGSSRRGSNRCFAGSLVVIGRLRTNDSAFLSGQWYGSSAICITSSTNSRRR